jgi:hypothetical protein
MTKVKVYYASEHRTEHSHDVACHYSEIPTKITVDDEVVWEKPVNTAEVHYDDGKFFINRGVAKIVIDGKVVWES